jgi:hypothetical protein
MSDFLPEFGGSGDDFRGGSQGVEPFLVSCFSF